MKTKISVMRCIAAVVGIFLVGAGVAFNASARLGNDSVGIFYDGIRSILGLTGEQLGIASNVVNVAIMIFLVFVGRRYVNIGTFIYILPYGFFVNLGTQLYGILFPGESFPLRVVGVIVGSLCICMGVAIFIVADIGVDPLTGLALWIGDKLKWEYRRAKMLLDACLTATGFLMGGKIGIVTLLVTLLGGSIIQFFSERLKSLQRAVKQPKLVSEVKR